MSHDGFLQAILDDPDDDTHRLVYADWLDEHGQPERAEFIRLQIELPRNLPRDDKERSPWLKGCAREAELMERYGDAWAGPIRGLVREWGFRRGFVEEVVAEAGAFVADAEALFRAAPVRRVRLYWGLVTPHERARFMGRVAECPQLARLRALDLSGAAFGSDGLRALAASENLPGLWELSLAANHVGDGGVRALIDAPWLPDLEELDLRRNDVGPNGIRALAARLEALAAAGRLRLRRLDFGGNREGAAGRRAVLASPVLNRVVRW